MLFRSETIIGQHPWVDDPQLELQRLEEQKKKQQAEMESQYDPFKQMQQQNTDDPNQGNQGGGINGTE